MWIRWGQLKRPLRFKFNASSKIGDKATHIWFRFFFIGTNWINVNRRCPPISTRFFGLFSISMHLNIKFNRNSQFIALGFFYRRLWFDYVTFLCVTHSHVEVKWWSNKKAQSEEENSWSEMTYNKKNRTPSKRSLSAFVSHRGNDSKMKTKKKCAKLANCLTMFYVFNFVLLLLLFS